MPAITSKTTDVSNLLFILGLTSKWNGTQNVWTILYQISVSLFNFLNGIRWFALLLCVVPGSKWGVYLGDVTYFMSAEERDMLAMVMALFSCFWFHSAFYIYQERWRNGVNLIWLDLLRTCAKESPKVREIGLFGKSATRFRFRVWLTTRLCLVYVVSFTLVCGVSCLFVGGVLFPPGFRLFGLFHGFSITVYCFYLIFVGYGMMFLFHQITYYFVLRFDDIHKKLKFLKLGSDIAVRRHLVPILRELDYVNNQIYRINQFWKYVLAADFGVILLTVLLMTYLGFFSRMVKLFQIALGTAAVLVFLVLCALSVSAASVAKKARQSYVVLNSLALKRMPTRQRFQLLFTIQRVAGPIKFLGFTCLDAYVITYSEYFHIMMHLFTHFLLLLDNFVIQKKINRAQDIIKMHYFNS